MDARRLKPYAWPTGVAAALLAGALLGWLLRPAPVPAEPDPEAIAAATLLSVREQGRMTTFAGRFVAAVTSSESRFGLSAEKTLIMPGTVRYSVDLGRLRRESLDWDAATRTLSVTLPPLEIAGPQIDVNQVREYREGGILMVLTDAEAQIDEANRQRAQQDLMNQARDPAVMQPARQLAMRNVARAFAMPLRAAGIDASVAVRFVDPAGRDIDAFVDRRHAIEDAVRTRN